MPTRDWNRIWDRHTWSKDGDEWTDQARFCGMDYDTWKRELVDAFINVNTTVPTNTILEIAPGHGRWTGFLLERVPRGRTILVDMNPSLIAFCKGKFAGHQNMEFVVNDGRSLPSVTDATIDFVWSYDSFVHIEPEETLSYLFEFQRVLRIGGCGCIHHPGSPTEVQRQRGFRSRTTQEGFKVMTTEAGLRVVQQTSTWGTRSNCKLFSDCITTFERWQ